MKRVMLWIVLLAIGAGAGAGAEEKAKLVGKHKSLEQLIAGVNIEKDEIEKFHLQNQILNRYSSASLAITEKNAGDALKWAEKTLKDAESFKDNWDYGNTIHYAHIVMGRVQLMRGDRQGAKQQLRLAAKTPGSPVLTSFGPNMTLAQELLAKDESAEVLHYFDECARFWNNKHAKATLSQWREEISRGKRPDFKAHLYY